MSYGDGADWAGEAQVTGELAVRWEVRWQALSKGRGPTEEVEFNITPSTSTDKDVANALVQAWNDPVSPPPGARSSTAALDPGDLTIVRFTKAGHSVECMVVQVGSGAPLALKWWYPPPPPPVAVVTGLTVANVP